MEQQLNSLNKNDLNGETPIKYNLNKRSVILRLAASVFTLTAFCILSYNMSLGKTMDFDRMLSGMIYSLRSDFMKNIFIPWTYLGNATVIISAIGVILAIPRIRWSIGMPTAVTSLMTFILYKFLKQSFARPRPEVIFHLIEQGGYSFPSGHSMNGLFCYGMMIFLIRRNCSDKKTADILSVALGLLILGIGFSRVFVGVHYPTDVIGGFLLGTVCLMLATLGIDKAYYNFRK